MKGQLENRVGHCRCGTSEPRSPREQIRRAGAEQRQRERQEHVLAGGFQVGRHDQKHPLIPVPESQGFFFCGFRTRLRLRHRPFVHGAVIKRRSETSG